MTDTIEKIAKKNKVTTTRSQVKLAVDDPVRMIKDFKKSSLDDVACFSKTLERLETDIDAMRVRANAWAKGNLAAIEKLDYADREEACSAAMTSGTFAKGQHDFQSMKQLMMNAWVATAEKALASNSSTFAFLRIESILDPKGMVAALRAKGYAVEKPD